MGPYPEGAQNTKLGKGEFINMRMFSYNIGCNLISCSGNGTNRFPGLLLEDRSPSSRSSEEDEPVNRR